MVTVIQRSVNTTHEGSLPEIYVEDTQIVLGEFVLVRNVPVNRLLDVQMDFSLAAAYVLCSALQYNALYAETVTLVLRSVCTMIFTRGEFATKDLLHHSMPDFWVRNMPVSSALFRRPMPFSVVAAVSFTQIGKIFDGAWL